MKTIKRIAALLLGTTLLLGLLSGCGNKKQGNEKLVLNVGVCGAIDSLDPAMNTDTDADSIFHALYENLMRESDDGSGEVMLTNGMAKEYTEETNYDGTVTYRALVGRGEGDGGRFCLCLAAPGRSCNQFSEPFADERGGRLRRGARNRQQGKASGLCQG